MELRQKTELRRLLIPELSNSLQVLAMPVLELTQLIQDELLANPTIEEVPLEELPLLVTRSRAAAGDAEDNEFDLADNPPSLYDILLSQLSISTSDQTTLLIGAAIIENIDENGYLRVPTSEIAQKLECTQVQANAVLSLIQQFDPPGVGASTTAECLLLQLIAAKQNTPHLEKIIRMHLDDIAKKNYTRIAKSLNEPLEAIEPLIKKILRLDPKPGRKYSVEQANHVIPDVRIIDKGGSLEIEVSRENIPELRISKAYRDLLRSNNADKDTKEFIRQKIRNALELFRAVSRRKQTLRKVVESIAELQQEAIVDGPSYMKPLTFKDVAQKIGVHETTVCRAVHDKYADTPWGIVALKYFFPSSIKNSAGENHSSSRIKTLINELISNENKNNPLSDQDIADSLKSLQVEVSRRTVTKYREESKIPSTVYRRIR